MTTGKTERYMLTTPGGDYVLDGTFKPAQLSPTTRSHNLVRARGYREVYDLSDGLPDPVPITLTGTVERGSEDELAADLRELRTAARTATAITRNDRTPVPLLGASVLAVPTGDDSNEAQVTLTFIPTRVPDEDAGLYDW